MDSMQAPDLTDVYGADTRRANRRRLLVFLGVFVPALAAGLGWNFLRPAEYRATARLHITPPVLKIADGRPEQASADATQAFLTEVQTLSSRPLIERVAERLRTAGHELSALGLDPVLGLQSTLTVTAVEGTQIAELAAVGRQPELPAALVAGITQVYREHLATTYRDSTDEATARADEEVRRLEATVAARRRAAEEFRVRNNIVSPEREENSILAAMQGLSRAQQDAHKRLLEAEGKVEALRTAAAAGKGVVRAIVQRWPRSKPAPRNCARNCASSAAATRPSTWSSIRTRGRCGRGWRNSRTRSAFSARSGRSSPSRKPSRS
jgi:succinoglycan biosynthesis transport protein ExoP